MTQIRKRLMITAVLYLFGLLATTAHAADDALVESWSAAWERVIDNALGGYLQRAADGPLSGLEEEQQQMALEDLYQLVYPAISWEALGQTVLENMTTSCGAEILDEIAPYISGDRDRATMSAGLAQDYASCAQSGMGAAMESIGAAIQSKYLDISATYAKYGIQYP